jgi:probable F420-dependent oxidoreductase
MRVGVAMAFNHRTPPDFIVEAARVVEASGFHSLWVPEHVLFFPDYASTYPYSDDGRIPGDPVGVLDPFSALTFIASHTSTLRLGTGICLVPQRQPVYTAKAVADLDYLSGGRVDFGVGIGWLKEEFDSLGMPFRGRAARCIEYLEVMRALWAPGVSRLEAGGYQLEACHFNPKPVQQPHPPIYFGGESDAALTRVARHGDGWYGYGLAARDVPASLARLEAALAGVGRRRTDVDVFIGTGGRAVDRDSVARYRDAGIDQLIVPLAASRLETLERRRDALIEALGT